MKFQLPLPNMSQIAFYILMYIKCSFRLFYSEQNSLLIDGGVPLAEFLDATYVTICILL